MNIDQMIINGKENGIIIQNGEELIITAHAKTDWFHHPAGKFQQNNVISAAMEITSKVFSITARIGVDFHSAYDAGAIFIQTGTENWAKIAFEYSAEKKPTIVSVITRKTSDDADGPNFLQSDVWLRIYSDGETIAFHFSEDGKYWKFLRWFSIPDLDVRPIKIGFGAQSPTGQGCIARFNNISIDYSKIENLRDGS